MFNSRIIIDEISFYCSSLNSKAFCMESWIGNILRYMLSLFCALGHWYQRKRSQNSLQILPSLFQIMVYYITMARHKKSIISHLILVFIEIMCKHWCIVHIFIEAYVLKFHFIRFWSHLYLIYNAFLNAIAILSNYIMVFSNTYRSSTSCIHKNTPVMKHL